MQRQHLLILLTSVILLLTVSSASLILAQTSASFGLNWHVIDSGGGGATSANYRVAGAIGQGLASQPTSSSASFVVSSGYWFGNTDSAAAPDTVIYLPLISQD